MPNQFEGLKSGNTYLQLTPKSVARLEDGNNPTAKINKDEQFYHHGILYTATQDIATTDTITPNTNCKLSDSVTGQLAQKVGWENTTSVVTQSSDLVESGAVCRAIGIDFKNLIYTKLSGYNVNSSGIIQTGSAYSLAVAKVEANKEYTVSPRASFTDTNIVFAFFTNKITDQSVSYNNSRTVISTEDNSYTFTAPINGYVGIRINTVNDNIQLELGSTATAYEPYHASVDESKCDNSVIGNVETTSASTHAYSAGQGFICDGQFRVAKGSGIAVSEQITDSNSDVKPIADLLNVVAGTVTVTDGTSFVLNYVRKIHNIVCVSVKKGISYTAGSGAVLLGTLPSGFFPPQEIYTTFTDPNGEYIGRIAINAQGKIYAKPSATLTDITIGFTVTYII